MEPSKFASRDTYLRLIQECNLLCLARMCRLDILRQASRKLPGHSARDSTAMLCLLLLCLQYPLTKEIATEDLLAENLLPRLD